MVYVAFLRGINVGGRIIKMSELKACFEKNGFENVSTLLQTGNVMFSHSEKNTDKLKEVIEQMLSEQFEYPAKTQVISLESLKGIVAANPFTGATADYHSYVIFIENNLEAELVAETGEQLGEEVRAGQGVVYWKVQKGKTLKSPLAKLLTKSKYKQFNTTRNINTLQKLIGL